MISFGGVRCSLVVSRQWVRMSSNRSYENAVQKLNSLQSNKATIQQIYKDIRAQKRCTNLEDMERYLQRCGVSMSKLDELSVIHVAGTKGKGSTSAMCESILRHHGFSTGFFSSPHLVSVCERIRLGGAVISREKFANYFHNAYDMLMATQAYEGDMPKYFAFLTVLAYKIFLSEKVDVAVVEVGIGGVVDYTNVLRKVPVVGITSLGLDHTSILGHTLAEIATAKAGIIKPACVAYTVAQAPEAMAVLRTVAEQNHCPLHVVPEYHSYTFPKGEKSVLPIDLDAYQTNASLAIQLAHAWMRIVVHNNKVILRRRKKILGQYNTIEQTEKELLHKVYDLPIYTVRGLQECRWPGRYQVVKSHYAEFYLDGAHTKESMEICAKWFYDNARYREKILIFSATGDRNVVNLLKPLINIEFSCAYFVVPTAQRQVTQRNDNFTATEQNELVNKCYASMKSWEELQEINDTKTSVFICVQDALTHIKNNHAGSAVLVTGSLHLVGASLSILDPSLNKL